MTYIKSIQSYLTSNLYGLSCLLLRHQWPHRSTISLWQYNLCWWFLFPCIVVPFTACLPVTDWFHLSICFHPLLFIFSNSCFIYLPSVSWIHLFPYVIKLSMTLILNCTQCWPIYWNWLQHILALQTESSMSTHPRVCMELLGIFYTIMNLCMKICSF